MKTTEDELFEDVKYWKGRADALAEVERVARIYYTRYAQDEAEELGCCLNDQQHEDAKALRDALAAVGGSNTSNNVSDAV
jgi:hypothetical protein